ncbi:ferric reduction oxidase 7, chloroplastic [Typha latifolia]|uniref:ferric reduction oxidase 7, chloroplastic n=1 Tax=Typha latifolia TaxID=4733 RepID=UPI003C2FD8B9
MAELSTNRPLLSEELQEKDYSGKTPLLPSLSKWVLKSLIWALFLTWAVAIFFYSSEFVKDLQKKWINLTQGTVFGITGSIFLAFSAPILVVAFLAFIYVAAFSGDNFKKKNLKSWWFRLWTFPVLVDGPFGVVSAAEFFGILLFVIYVIWTITAYTLETSSLISKFSLPSMQKWYLMLELTGLRFGSIGLFCMIFLFLPVARGSILLRLIDIPFEHATRYHVWLGHLTMIIFTLHGLCYMISWSLQHRFKQEMLDWKDIGVANLPGVISLIAGLLMWVTSLHPVRKNYFELFFYTHQLYVIFVVFLALHVGDFIFSIAAGAIFLFILDRFVRFCQSRTKVDIVSAACRPCGTVELILSKPANLRYNALSFIFLQVRELSWLQWHPFSVSSSPLDGKYHLSVLIKVLGTWTSKLQDIISNFTENPGKITASVEGPYGHESPYHLMYENLILVAGGIGVSPFLAILSDILHRISEGKPCLPKNILVVWAVKKSKELSLLSAVDFQTSWHSFSDKLHLDIQSYVTQESEPSLEEGKVDGSMKSPSIFITNGSSMSCLVGTGNNIWAGIYVVVSTLGFIILFGMVEVYYIQHFNIYAWWYRGLLFILCMVAGVVVFGGIVVFLWHKLENRSSSYEECPFDDEKSSGRRKEQTADNETTKTDLASFQTIQYGYRPDFRAIFDSFSEQIGRTDVGIIVCGPPSLQSSVARECRSQNLRGRRNNSVFHFNSHSFDL